jgi:glycosyltransferase involved in cell wall biosynthesis
VSTIGEAPRESGGRRGTLATDAGRGRPLHVLFLSPRLPWPLHSGTHQRLFHLARGVAARHDVTVIAFDGERPDRPASDVAAFRAASGCARVELASVADCAFHTTGAFEAWAPALRSLRSLVDSPLPVSVRRERSPALVRRLVELQARTPVDVVLAGKAYMAEHAREAGLGPIVLDADDLEGPLALARLARMAPYRRRWLHRLEARKTARYERHLTRRFAHVLVCKEEDRAFFPAAERAAVSVVPNGVEVPEHVDATHESPDTILFVGTLAYAPNLDAVAWFHGEVLPHIRRRRPDARFQVVGRAFPSGYAAAAQLYGDVAADPLCEVHQSPLSLRPFYERASVVVAPVRFGGGTRIKVLEAPAYGKALVATTFAPEGLDLRPDVDLVLADAPEAFAQACVALLADPRRRRALGDAARERVRERYEWTRIEPAVGELADAIARAGALNRAPSAG